MISHSKASKPPPRFSNTKLANDAVSFGLHGVDSSYESKSQNDSNVLFSKRRSSRLIAQSIENEKTTNSIDDLSDLINDDVRPSTSIDKSCNDEQYSDDLFKEESLINVEDIIVDEETVNSKSNHLTNNEEDEEEYLGKESNSTFRPGRRKQIFDLEDNNINYPGKSNINSNITSSEEETNKSGESNEVFGNIRRLFPKTNDTTMRNFSDSFDMPPRVQINSYKNNSFVLENSHHINVSSSNHSQKPKQPINYLTEQALASIANNEKTNPSKAKQRITRPYLRPTSSKVYDDNEGRNNSSLDTPIFSSYEVVKKPLPKVNVIVSRTTHPNFNSSFPKLIEQKTFFNVTNTSKNSNNNVFAAKNSTDEKILQTTKDISKTPTFCREITSSLNQQKFKTITLKSIDTNPQKNNNINICNKSISNQVSNQPCRVLVKGKSQEESLLDKEKQDSSKISSIVDSQEKPTINLRPTTGRVVVIKSTSTNNQNVMTKSEQPKNVDHNVLTTPFASEPGPSGIQTIKPKINQSTILPPTNNKFLKYHSRVNFKRNHISSDSNNSSQSSNIEQTTTRLNNIDRSPVLLQGLKTKIPINKLREIAMRCFIPRSITLHSLIYKRSRRPYNFVTNNDGKLIMVSSSGKNVISKGPIEYEVLSKLSEIPSLSKFASTHSDELESGLYQTTIVCAYFTSFYSVKMFKIVKRREYFPRSYEALPFYPTKSEIDEEILLVPKKRKRSKSCEFPISNVDDYLVVYIPVTALKKYGLINNDGRLNYENNITNSQLTPERKVRVSQKIYDTKIKNFNDNNYSDDMEGELKGITVSVEIPPPRQSNNKESRPETSNLNITNSIVPENKTLETCKTRMIGERIINIDEYNIVPVDLNSTPNNDNDIIESEINNQNDSIGITNKKTIRTIYTHPNKMIKDTRTTIIPSNNKRFFSNKDIPNDVSKILDYYKLSRETAIYTDEKLENIRNFGRRMTASYQYLHRKKDIELWNIVDEIKKELKKVESKNESEKVPGDNQSNLIQTIKGQVLKRGRGRPRKSETEKTVLEEEIIKRSDEGMGDIKEIDEECLLSTEDMLIERENNGYNMDQFLYKDIKDDETVLALASIDNDLSVDRMNGDKLKRSINNSYGFTLDPMTKDDNEFFGYHRDSTTPFDEYGERRKIVSHSNEGKECYRAISKEDYPIYKGRCTALSLVDDMLQKNCSEIGYGVKYHTLKEMEINEYDKVPKTEEAIYGPRPNAYTRFIEDNKDMFLNDCSLRYVFDEIGQIRKFPLYGDDNNIPRYNFERDESTFFDNDSLEEEGGVRSYNKYNNVYEQNNMYDEEEGESLQTDDEDEEEYDEEEEEDNGYSDHLVRSKLPSIENYQSKMMLHNHYMHNLSRMTKKQRKQRIGKPRGPYMTKKRRMEALKASQGLLSSHEDSRREKRPVGRPKGSTKRKSDSCTPIDPALISLNDSSVPKKAKTEDIYCRPTFNSILAGNRSPTEYAKTKLRHVR